MDIVSRLQGIVNFTLNFLPDWVRDLERIIRLIIQEMNSLGPDGASITLACITFLMIGLTLA